MEAKFTPGPWRLIPPGEPTPGPMYRELIALVAHDPSLYVVLDDGHPLDRVPPDEWEANARLIAAAPDLYVALTDIMRCIATDELIQESVSYMRQARAALAKAVSP